MSKILFLFQLLLVVSLCLQFSFKKELNTSIPIDNIQFTDDESFFAIASEQNLTVEIYNPITLTKLTTIQMKQDDIPNSLGFAHDNSYLALGDMNGALHLFKREGDSFSNTSKTIETQTSNGIVALSFNNDNSMIALGMISATQSVMFYDTIGDTITPSTINFGQLPNTLKYSPTNTDLIVGGLSKAVLYDNALTEKNSFSVSGRVNSMKFTSDGTRIAIQVDNVIRFFNSADFT